MIQKITPIVIITLLMSYFSIVHAYEQCSDKDCYETADPLQDATGVIDTCKIDPDLADTYLIDALTRNEKLTDANLSLLEKNIIALLTDSHWSIQAKALHRLEELSESQLIDPPWLSRLRLEEKMIAFLSHKQWQVQKHALSLFVELSDKGWIDAAFVRKIELNEKMKLLLVSPNKKVLKQAWSCLWQLLNPENDKLIDSVFVKNLELEEKIIPLLAPTQTDKVIQSWAFHCLESLARHEFIDSTFVAKLDIEEKLTPLFIDLATHNDDDIIAEFCLNALIDKGLIETDSATRLSSILEKSRMTRLRQFREMSIE